MKVSKDFEQAIEIMIQDHLIGRGIQSESVLNSMRVTPREKFINNSDLSYAYGDFPLLIGEGQTISQPYIVALTAEAMELSKKDKVLEIGTGSGYSAAVLSYLSKVVYSVERLPGLVLRAKLKLQELGYSNVYVIQGDGSVGLQKYSPYDAIAVTAGAHHVPEALLKQLAIGGRLVIPVGESREYQILMRIKRNDEDDFKKEELCEVRFVPLIGEDGWGK